jgi:hypothetical protein
MNEFSKRGPCDVFDSVAATAKDDKGDIETFDEFDAVGVSIEGEIEEADTII